MRTGAELARGDPYGLTDYLLVRRNGRWEILP